MNCALYPGIAQAPHFPAVLVPVHHIRAGPAPFAFAERPPGPGIS